MEHDHDAELLAERSARRAAEQQRDFYRRVLAQSPIATNVHLGPDLRFEIVHPQMQGTFGGKDLLGVNVGDLDGDDGHRTVIAAMRQVYETGVMQRFEVLHREFATGDGQLTRGTIHVVARRLEGDDHEPLGVIVQFGQTDAIWRWFQGVLDSLPLGVVLAEAATGRMLFANSLAKTICQEQAPLQVGPCPDAAHLPIAIAIADGADSALVGSRRYNYSTWTLPADTVMPSTVMLMAEDVSSLHVAEAALKTARHAVRQKDEAVAHMAHELRNPLGAIIGFSELASSGELTDDETSDYWQRVHKAAKQALELATGYLTAATDGANIAIANQPFAPTQMILDVVQTFAAIAAKKGLHLDLSQKVAMLPASFVSDPLRLRQILTNLLANAVKFTDAGAVEIDGEIRVTSTGRELCLRVADTGLGMSEEQQQRLFLPYERGFGEASTRPGAGLGLSLAHRLAELLGGDMHLLHSTPGVGTAFEVCIPEKTDVLRHHA